MNSLNIRRNILNLHITDSRYHLQPPGGEQKHCETGSKTGSTEDNGTAVKLQTPTVGDLTHLLYNYIKSVPYNL